MLGAIIGDIVGSPYEFSGVRPELKTFPLFGETSVFTDDTVMTLAVARALMDGYGSAEKTEQAVISSMRELGGMFPDVGYGSRFSAWLAAEEPAPYQSCGNGSAMRVSPVGWAFDDMDDVLKYAEITARVTHNHKEGIKWAQATAAAILLARKGASKESIKAWIEEKFDCAFVLTCDEIRPNYVFDETCQGTVPEALTAFFEGDSFENVVRTAASLGGDCDTLTAIAASVAEAYYPVPEAIRREALRRLDAPLLAILYRFEEFLREKNAI